jgi:hypothetical protein
MSFRRLQRDIKECYGLNEGGGGWYTERAKKWCSTGTCALLEIHVYLT